MEMTNFKCKTCGAALEDLAAKSVNGLVTCPYCGNVWTVPKQSTSPEALQFLHMGEHDLDTGKFDDAYAAYKKASELDAKEPEAYFGMALAEFKIQYLKDHVNNRVQPICYEVTDKKFTDCNSYLRAVINATPEQKSEYEKKGAEIDYILGEFYKLKQSGLDYDCFICVKVTDDKTKQVTEDSKDADYIYRLLQDKGYKPFYSERELRNVTGADYEARILYALSTSECMLVVCRNEAYLQTPWVKNEYMRFLKLINDEEKESDSITIVFNGAPIEKLPGKNGKIQGINFALREADGKIVNFVDSHTPEAKARKEEAERRKAKEQEETAKRFKELEEQIKNAATVQKPTGQDETARQLKELQEQLKSAAATQNFGGATVMSLLKRGYQELEDGNFQNADSYFNRIIDAEPENGEAYLGKLLAELRIKKRENLPMHDAVISEYANYKKAYRYGDKNLQTELKSANESIKQAHCKQEYSKAVAKMNSAKRSEDFLAAAAIFRNIAGYSDSDALYEKCKTQAETAFANEKYNEACLLLSSENTDKIKSAIKVFEQIPNWRDSTQKIAECNEKIENLKLQAEIDRKNSIYDEGCRLLSSSEIQIIEKAIKVFEQIPDWKDSTQKIAECNEKIERKKQEKIKRRKRNILLSVAAATLIAIVVVLSVTLPPYISAVNDKKARHGLTMELSADGSHYIVTGVEDDTISKITIPDKYKNLPVAEISDKTFFECDNLTNVIIPNSVTSIGWGAFWGCSSLTSISIPNGVTFIGGEAFTGCSNLTSITIPDSVTEIGYSVFESCTSLTSITIPDSVTSIGSWAFNGCTSLMNITIPNSVTYIGSNAFNGCSSLTSTIFEEPNGWHLDGKELLKIKLTNPQTNATYLTKTYCYFYWERG